MKRNYLFLATIIAIVASIVVGTEMVSASTDTQSVNISYHVRAHHFAKKTDVTSGQYYLMFWGGNANTTQKVKGSIHD